MFGGHGSITQILLILGIVILVFGTKKLRNIGGDLGGAISNFKKAMRNGEQDAAQAESQTVTQRVVKQAVTQTPAQTPNVAVESTTTTTQKPS
mgnify:FL=1